MVISISSEVVKSLYGDCQPFIKQMLEADAESYQQQSLLKHLFRVQDTKHAMEEFKSLTAADGMKPVGEGGAYPEDSFEEGYSKIIKPMTWKDRIAVTEEMVEDAVGDFSSIASTVSTKLTDGNGRTREEFGRAMYAGAITGKVEFMGRKFDCMGADGKTPFATDHKNKVNGKMQCNCWSDAFSEDVLGKMEEAMQDVRGDNGELLALRPDTILIPNIYSLRKQVLSVVGSDKDPFTSNNGFNYQYGRWNIIVDPYLKAWLPASAPAPVILLDSNYIQKKGGPEWLDRVDLSIESKIDQNTGNNMWDARARFSAGFSNWRPMAICGVAGGKALN